VQAIKGALGNDFNSNNTVTAAVAGLRTDLENNTAAGHRAWGELARVGVVYDSALD